MKRTKILTAGLVAAISLSANAQNYRIVDTEQTKFFDNKQEIAAPQRANNSTDKMPSTRVMPHLTPTMAMAPSPTTLQV
ncbi:MAG: hypothetical protein SNG45_06370 [Rikenellaceae bacterium]